MGIVLSQPERAVSVLQYGLDEDDAAGRYLRTAGGVSSEVSAYRLPRPGRIIGVSLQLAAAGTVLAEVRKLGLPDALASLLVDAAVGGEAPGLGVPVEAGDVLQVFVRDPEAVDIARPLPVDEHTVAKYPFDEESGTVFADVSGNGLDGSVVGNPVLGAASRPGFGRALEFPGSTSGSSDFATVPDSPLFDLPVGTVECSVKLDALAGVQGVFARDASGQSQPGHTLVVVNADGSVTARLQNLTQSVEITTPAGLIVPGAWHHLACLFGGPQGLELYVDGVLRASDTGITTGINGNDEPWVFGVRNWASNAGSPTPVDGGTHMDGLLDDLRISDVRRRYVAVGVDRPVATVHVEHP
jgi:hypothetical protein